MSRIRMSMIALPVLAAVGAVGTASAQIPLSPRALGMAGAYVATARGFESVLFNPANLGLADTPAWSVSFPQITAGSSVLGPKVSDLPDFLNYDDLDPARREALLATIPETGTSVDLVVRAPVAALQVGRLGMALSYGWLGEHTVGKDLVELFFEGYESGRTDYTVGETVGTRASFWDFAAGYGAQVGPVSVGVTGHYYRGGSLVRTKASGPEYNFLVPPHIQVHYVGVYSEGGSGYGIDVGAAYQPIHGLTVSAAVANVLGSMNWDEELVGRQITLTEADFEQSEFAILQDRWRQSEEQLGTTPTGRFAEVAAALNPDAWDVPTTVRLGAAWQPVVGTEVGVAYHTSSAAEGEGLLGGKWGDLLGFGIQQRIPFVTLRLGASTNLEEGSMFGGGIKLGVVDLAAARFTTAGVLTDADRDGWAASMSVNVQTRGLRR